MLVRLWCVVVVAVLMSGCGAQPSVSPGPVSSQPVPSVTAVPTTGMSVASSPSDEPSVMPSATFDPDQLVAAETVERWFRLWDEAEADLEAPVEEFSLLMMGDTQARVMARLADVRAAGSVGVGTVKVHILGAEGVQQQAVGKSVYVLACTDASEYDLVDSDTGESVLDPNRGFYVHWRINVVYSEAANQWFISDYTSDLGEPCLS